MHMHYDEKILNQIVSGVEKIFNTKILDAVVVAGIITRERISYTTKTWRRLKKEDRYTFVELLEETSTEANRMVKISHHTPEEYHISDGGIRYHQHFMCIGTETLHGRSEKGINLLIAFLCTVLHHHHGLGRQTMRAIASPIFDACFSEHPSLMEKKEYILNTLVYPKPKEEAPITA